jgi:hypothetical protein
MRLLVLALLLGCPPATGPEPIDISVEPGDNPLIPGRPALPFPSDLLTAPDPSSATGLRVAIPDGTLPEGVPPALFDRHDGFSRVPALLAWFQDGVDPASLPAHDDPLATLEPDSPVRVIELATGAPHPVFVELDANVNSPLLQALIIRPHGALKAATTYAVVLTDRLASLDGGALPSSPALQALRSGEPTNSPAVEAMRPAFEQLWSTLEGRGVARDEVVLAWTFTTRSEQQVTGALRALQASFATVALPAPTIVSDSDEGEKRIIEGTFTAPEYLSDTLDFVLDDGLPVQQGTREVPFRLGIPREVGEPRPVVLFGHGFFSGRVEATGGSFFALMRDNRMSSVAIDFQGFSEEDLASTALILGGRLDRIGSIIDQQVQNVARFTLLARLVREHLSTEVQDPTGAYHPLTDDVQYLGISNGGTQGLSIMSTSPVLDRGTLVVPGGGWTHMLQRAVQWREFAGLLEETYNPLDLQIVMAALQSLFDPADCLNYVEHLVDDRFPEAAPDVRLGLHMAVHDSQVTNLVTGWVARTSGVPLVEPSPWALPGHPTVPGDAIPGPAALFVYAEDVEPAPDDNVPPESDNDAHASIRDLSAYRQQVGAFLQDGTLAQVCDGACDPD